MADVYLPNIMRNHCKFSICAHTLVLGLGLIGVSASFAQDVPLEDSDEIRVTGIREEEKVIDAYLRDLSDVDPQSPMARYEPGQYCPKVIGLAPSLNEQIAARMHKVAEAANVRPAGVECKTSALVMFADDHDTLQTAFRKEHPEYFQELSGETISYQGKGTDVLSWKLIGRLDRNLNPVGTDEDGVQIVEIGMASSRLQAVTRPVVAMSVLLIKRSAVVGLSTQQIADYALMRTLTDTDPGKLVGSRAPTILGVIDAPDGSATPLSLTPWDLAYVKGRYASDEWNFGGTQLAKIRATVRGEVLGEPQGE